MDITFLNVRHWFLSKQFGLIWFFFGGGGGVCGGVLYLQQDAIELSVHSTFNLSIPQFQPTLRWFFEGR